MRRPSLPAARAVLCKTNVGEHHENAHRNTRSSCAVAAVFVAGGVHAETLKPIQARSIDLGALAGSAYYTVEPEGYRLVATLMPSGTDTPVRFVATLAPGQSVTLSTARMLGESAVQVRFMRQGDELFVAGAKSPEVVTH
jgi:hypothetical protein